MLEQSKTRRSVLIGFGASALLAIGALMSLESFASPASTSEPYDRAVAAERERLYKERTSGENGQYYLPPKITVTPLAARASLVRGLPGYRFYYFMYTMRPRPAVMVSTPGGLGYTFAVGPSGQHYRLPGTSNSDDEFGRMLMDNGIKIRSSQEARNVWNMYSDLYGGSKKAKIRQLSPTQWEMGSEIISNDMAKEDDRYYELVTLRADKTVKYVQMKYEIVKG